MPCTSDMECGDSSRRGTGKFICPRNPVEEKPLEDEMNFVFEGGDESPHSMSEALRF